MFSSIVRLRSPRADQSGEQLPIMSDLVMDNYFLQPPACLEYDTRAAEVAQRIAEAIMTCLPTATVEHIGSTAVPGCAGKGVVDLMVLYPDGQLEAARETLDSMGLQRQTVGHLFSESRPMRVGAVVHKGSTFRVHIHVIAASSTEAAALRAFRERLRADPETMAAYVARKRDILAASVTDPQLYTRMKTAFIRQALAACGDASLLPSVPDWSQAASVQGKRSRRQRKPHREGFTGPNGSTPGENPGRR
jgi:GrpB-like predicted nucleotidyltransferase (UPF0157 family)